MIEFILCCQPIRPGVAVKVGNINIIHHYYLPVTLASLCLPGMMLKESMIAHHQCA
jgi:NADH:ubiquinone oxidoreductase subunit 6 (subunit J)